MFVYQLNTKIFRKVINDVLGVQLFGSFQKIMMLPLPSFEVATNWLLEVLWTPQKITAINFPIQECQMYLG